MAFVETSDLKIHYRQAGTGDTPVIFLHGNYASSRWWEPLLAQVPDGYRAFAPDLRGCGSRESYTTTSGTGKLTIEILARDLANFLTALDIGQAALVGHSLGGQVVTTYAMQMPENVLALILEDTGPAGGIPLGSITTPLLLPLEIKSRRLIRRSLITAGIPIAGTFSDALVDDSLSAPRGLYYRFTRAAAAWKAGKALKGITAPTLLIWGARDAIMPSRYAQAYLDQIPGAELALIPNSGHSPHLERTVEFANRLYAFLDRHARAGKSV